LDGAPSDRKFRYHGRRYRYDSIQRYIGISISVSIIENSTISDLSVILRSTVVS